MRTEADKYISTKRLQLKAHLGVTWAVQFPEKVFSMIDEQINNVRWYDVAPGITGAHISITLVNKANIVDVEVYIHDDKSLFDLLLEMKGELEAQPQRVKCLTPIRHQCF